MAVELINIGRIANDGTGDDLREAFDKINRNFEDLDLRIDDKTEGENVGTGTGVFKQRLGYNLQFKTLVEGDNVLIDDLTDTVRITAAIPTAFENLVVVTDQGSLSIAPGQNFRINGGDNINTTVDTNSNSIVINAEFDGTLAQDPSPTLNATLNANSQNIINGGVFAAQNFVGDLNSVDSDTFQSFYNDLDFGDISLNITNLYDYLRVFVNVDMGSFDEPTVATIDLGTF